MYFEEILAKALLNYSYQWDSAINFYLRIGENYFSADIFKNNFKRYGRTIDEAILAIKAKIVDLDRVFLEASSKNESLDTIYYRGMKTPFSNLTNIGDTTILPNFISISTKYNIASSFAGSSCCFYKIILSKGVPYINMINTSEFEEENEILLPRDLVYEIIKIEKSDYFDPILTLKVKLQHKDQFKMNHNCRDFYLGILKYYNPSYLKNSITSKEKKESPKKISKRCPNGTRKNKISGLCESTKSDNKTKKQKNIIKNKLPRCKNGTRRNKVTGNCEPL